MKASNSVNDISRIRALATEVFGDAGKAEKWLHQPLGILDGRSPIEVAKTREGAVILERLLGNIAWGGAA